MLCLQPLSSIHTTPVQDTSNANKLELTPRRGNTRKLEPANEDGPSRRCNRPAGEH
jgi:hypothetical protein